jgi:hypothetical protein
MDKAEYVARAPIYYALAIAVALARSSGPMPEFKLKSRFPHIDDTNPHEEESGTLLDRWMIWERAVGWLVARNMVKIKHDPFGPPIFSMGEDFHEQWNELILDEELPFSTFKAADESDDWLVPALYSIENHFVNMDMKAEDFDNPDAEWTPIKVDSEDPGVKKAVSTLEDIIEEVRSDNGYSSTHPHERDHVLEGLQGALDKFKSSSISPGYVRIAIERLRTLGRRFGGTLKEAGIAAAKAALIEFAKKHFGEFLSYLWKWPF